LDRGGVGLGAAKGIGAGIAKAMPAPGASVVVNYASDRDRAERIVAEIGTAGGNAFAIQANISVVAEVEHLFAEAVATFGRLDILVNNASVFAFALLEQTVEPSVLLSSIQPHGRPLTSGTFPVSDWVIKVSARSTKRLIEIRLALIRGRLIENDGEADDLSFSDTEVVRHDQLLWKVRLVVFAIVGRPNDRVAVVVDDLSYLKRDLVSDHLFLHPPPDRIDTRDLAAVVVDIGIFGEGGDNRIGVESVHGLDVLGDDAREFTCHGVLLLSTYRDRNGRPAYRRCYRRRKVKVPYEA
jgi:hypothetical protein